MTTDTGIPTVAQLRRRWTPQKQRLRGRRSDHPTPIRVHRALSWLSVAEQEDDATDHDLNLITQWIAFNALYGQWDEAAGESLHDRECREVFLGRILDLDADVRRHFRTA